MLYKRGDIWHFDFTLPGGERQRGSTGQTSKTAARKVEERERERSALGGLHGDIPTLGQTAAKWFRSRAEHRRSVVTVAHRLKIALRHVDPNMLVTNIGTPDIEAAVQARRLEETHNGRAPTNATVNRDIVETLRPVIRYAEQVLELPVRKIAWQAVRLPEPPERVRTFTAAELRAWRSALPPWHRPVFDFLRLYGVRLREAFFHPDRLDVEAGTVKLIDRKNGRDLIQWLLPEDVTALAARAARAKLAGLDTVWFRDNGGKLTPIHWRGFQSASKTALIGLGMGDARPAHDLRHHAGTTIRRFGDVTVAQMLLGHEDIRSTARYAHADKDALLTSLRHARATWDAEPEINIVETTSKTG